MDQDPVYFASSQTTLRFSTGQRVSVDTSIDSDLSALVVSESQQQQSDVVGAIPFDRSRVPVALWRRSPDYGEAKAHADHGSAEPLNIVAARSLPSQHLYQSTVGRAIHRIKTTSLQKVVLSRRLDVPQQKELDHAAVTRHLAHENPSGFTYNIDVSDDGGLKRFIGTSPELLVRRHGRLVESNPLAGSIPRSSNPDVDRARADSLVASRKDRYEHALVVEQVTSVLRRYCGQLLVPKEPRLIATPTMWHLSTPICGWLDDLAVSSLELGLALHPTPAVCGHPVELAKRTIDDLEPFDRGYFCGLVGWCGPNGDGEWAVAIRCAEITSEVIRVYAGAGIVEESVPGQEYQETEAKMQTLLRGLGFRSSSQNLREVAE